MSGEPAATTARGLPARLLGRSQRAALEAGRRFGTDKCTLLGAAISYRTIFSIFPALLFTVSILGIVMRNDELRDKVVDDLVDRLSLTEEAGKSLEGTLANVPAPSSVAGVVSILVLLWSASGLMSTVRRALQTAWDDDESRPFARAKLVDLLFVLLVAALLVVSVGLTFVVQVVATFSTRVEAALGLDLPGVGEILGYVAPFVVAFVALVLIYRYAPTGRPPFRHVAVGALLAAAALELFKFGFAFYLTHFADYNRIYGSIGAVIGFLYFAYLAALIFLFCGEFAYAWHRDVVDPPHAPEPEESVPLAQRLKRAGRGLFVRGPRR
jgi:membrane protein